MRFAFADPPYLGLASFYADKHPEALDYDRIEKHAELIARLESEFSDGWAMCLHSPALARILPLCPEGCRVSAWVKPFCSFKPGVGVAYAWEPIIWKGGRCRTREQQTVRDWAAVNIALEKGLVGAKPAGLCRWLLEILGFDSDLDELVDLFPGTGVMGRVVDGIRSRGHETLPMFAPDNEPELKTA